MNFQNIYKNPIELINDLENYTPYIIKVKCYNREESGWLQNKPYYNVLFDNKYFEIQKTKFPIKYIEKITFKTKNNMYGKCEYDFFVSKNYYENEIKNGYKKLKNEPIKLEKDFNNKKDTTID